MNSLRRLIRRTCQFGFVKMESGLPSEKEARFTSDERRADANNRSKIELPDPKTKVQEEKWLPECCVLL